MPRVLLIAVLLLGSLTACRDRGTPPAPPTSSAPSGASTTVHSLTVDGRQRTYRLYVPAGLGSAVPLVLMLHGGFGTGEQAEQWYGWDAQADAGHFAVAYPDGLNRAWNTGGGCCGSPGRTGVDDVAFLTAVVADVSRTLPVDADRVYATGISNGGMMAYRLACDTTLFAAIGPDSATLLGDCPHPAALSVIHIHGTADGSIRYGGGQGGGVAKIVSRPIPEVVAGWAVGCAAPSVRTAGAVTTSIASCPRGRTVELITVAGAGHQWPGGASKPAAERVLGLDPPSRALDATATIWRFFSTHPRLG